MSVQFNKSSLSALNAIQAFDKDKDGKVTKAETAEFLYRAKGTDEQKLIGANLLVAFDKTDADASKSLTFSELTTLFGKDGDANNFSDADLTAFQLQAVAADHFPKATLATMAGIDESKEQLNKMMQLMMFLVISMLGGRSGGANPLLGLLGGLGGTSTTGSTGGFDIASLLSGLFKA